MLVNLGQKVDDVPSSPQPVSSLAASGTSIQAEEGETEGAEPTSNHDALSRQSSRAGYYFFFLIY